MKTKSDKHNITPQMLPMVVQSFRIKGYSQSTLAEMIGKSEGILSIASKRKRMMRKKFI